MEYKISFPNATEHFIQVAARLEKGQAQTILFQLPSWRPGRYELANYARNVRGFNVKDEHGTLLPFHKITKDCWEVNTGNAQTVVAEYEYYANQPDAGASFVDNNLLYLNPVNCLLYAEGRLNEGGTVELDIPETWQIACQLPNEANKLHFSNFDLLADSPFFASPNLCHHSFELLSTTYHFWFEGLNLTDFSKLEHDTRLYADLQTRIMGENPCRNYHFLYLMRADRFRHGVEHLDSTVIAMGPATDFSKDEFYHDFLAISSHELFHLWNIKRIRPVEMLPYDFTRENYSTLGYVYEGITTYFGDLMLLRSGVWDWNRYVLSFSADLTRVLTNAGRFNYSLAESGFDTWLDGYTPGIPGRKVSIYFDGLAAAFIADILLLEATGGSKSMDDVMRMLYAETYKKSKGYNEYLYRQCLESIAGISFETYFKEVIHGRGKIDIWLTDALSKIGLSAERQVNSEGVETIHCVKFSELTSGQMTLFDFWMKRN